MDARATIPPGLPRPNPTASYWQTSPASLAHHRTAASGATGRNGGHTKCASYRSYLSNAAALGQAEALHIVLFEYACMKAVHAFAREHGIACDSWEGDTVDVIYDEAEWALARSAIAEIGRALGPAHPAAQHRFWDAAETEQRFRTPGAIGAVTYEAGSISAYKFVVGVLDLVISKGLNLQTETPATSIEKNDGGWMIATPRGGVRTSKVVLATNGYSAHLCPQLQGLIVPLRGHMTVHRPGTSVPSGGLSTTYSFIYDGGYEYMISRPPGTDGAGDIAIGGCSTRRSDGGIEEFGNTDDTSVDPVILNLLRDSTEEYFRHGWGDDHKDGRIRQEWTGIMGYSADGFPFLGEMPDETNLFIAASFQGHGMVLCFLVARALAEIMMGGTDENANSKLPNSFLITKARMTKKFQGRLHTTNAKKVEEETAV